MLKLLTAVNDEYHHLLTEDKFLADSQWFEEQDERIFSFKHKIIKWLKEAELNKEEKRSRKSVGFRSSKSSRSSNRSSRSNIKDKATEEKIKIAESNFTDQKLKMEYEAKRLEMEEKVAKAQARANILDLLDMPPLEGQEDAKGSSSA